MMPLGELLLPFFYLQSSHLQSWLMVIFLLIIPASFGGDDNSFSAFFRPVFSSLGDLLHYPRYSPPCRLKIFVVHLPVSIVQQNKNKAMCDIIDFMDTKKKAIGIVLLSKDEKGELVAILQVRSKWNAEKNAPESWPGACQVTTHGKCEEGEDFMQALLREVEEELGKEIVPIIKKLSDAGKLTKLVNNETPEKHIITYGVVVDKNIFQALMKKKKKPSFGGFKLINNNDVEKIVDIQKFDKTLGVVDKNVIAMFPDHKEAIKIAFEKLG